MKSVLLLPIEGVLTVRYSVRMSFLMTLVPAQSVFFIIDSTGGDQAAAALLMDAFGRCMDREQPVGCFIEHAEGPAASVAIGCLELFIGPAGTLGGDRLMEEDADAAERHRRVEVFRNHHPGDSRRLVGRLLRGDVLTAGEVQEAGVATLATDEDHALMMFKQRLREHYGKEVL